MKSQYKESDSGMLRHYTYNCSDARASLENRKKFFEKNAFIYNYEYTGVATDEDKYAFKKLKDFADSKEQSNLITCFLVGVCYEEGIVVKKDEKEAFEYYKIAATQEFSWSSNVFIDIKNQARAKAENNLAVCYQKGIGVKKDEKKAFDYCKKAADKGGIYAQNNLAVCYQKGIGVEKDEKKAVELYKEAADKGDIYAQNNLSLCYYEGIGVEKDERQAFEYCKKAADKGHVEAQSNLAVCYQKGIGVEKDEMQAFEYCKKAADNGDIYAQKNLALFYEKRIDVDKGEKKAVELYKKAADNGDDNIGENVIASSFSSVDVVSPCKKITSYCIVM